MEGRHARKRRDPIIPPGEIVGEVLQASRPDEMPDLGPRVFSKEAKDG
jgi:hypothetical protein